MITLIWLHFIADFLLQNDDMALNKSSSNGWLGIHSLFYALIFTWFGWKFALLAGVSHFIIDWITSRGTSFLWKIQDRHWFFVLIGFDQVIHLTILVLLLRYL